MSKDQANTSGVSGDKEMEEAVKKVNENTDYKVLTREEYDKLLSLAHKNVLPSTPAPSAPAPVSRLAGLLGPLRKSTPHGGAKPKFTMRNPLVTPPPFHSMQNALNESQLHNTSFIPQSYNFPKLPIFSGSQEPQKGEVTFEVWSFEVRCLKMVKQFLNTLCFSLLGILSEGQQEICLFRWANMLLCSKF